MTVLSKNFFSKWNKPSKKEKILKAQKEGVRKRTLGSFNLERYYLHFCFFYFLGWAELRWTLVALSIVTGISS